MDKIKNNWGFIAISIVCLVIVVILAVKCNGALAELRSAQEGYEKNVSYLDGVGKKHIKLTEENVALSEKNQAVTTKQIQAVRKEISDRFVLKYAVPKTAIAAKQELKARITKMQEQAETAEIALDSSAEYFSFDTLYKSNTLPPEADIAPIFRQLTIVSELLNIIQASHISGIKSIKRPMNLQVQDEADYTITPIEVTVNGTAEHCQDFVNAMSSQEHYLFVLRTVEIDAPDVFTEIVADLRNMSSGGGQNLMKDSGERRDGFNNGENRTSRRSRRNEPQEEDMNRTRRNSRNSKNARQERTPQERGDRGSEDGLVEIPLRRQELMAFETKETAWVLRFDLIEPKVATPEQTEEKAE